MAQLQYRFRPLALSVTIGGLAQIFLSGSPEAAAQSANTGSGFSSSGNNGNPLSTIPASTTQLQDWAFRSVGRRDNVSLAGWQAYRNYRMRLQSNDNESTSSDVARFGPVRTSLWTSVGVTYDSNINNSPTSPQADIYTNLYVNLGVHWIATKRNELNLNLGFDYVQYFGNTQYNQSGLLISPNTGLDYSLYFLDFVLTVYDHPSIINNGGTQDPAVTNFANFRQFNNRGGLSILWPTSRLLFLTGIERSDTISLTNDDFSSQNSTGYSWYGIVSGELTPTTDTGLRLQVSTIEYSQQVLNDSIMTQAGVFCQSQLTRHTSIYAEVGIQTGTFFNTGNQSDDLEFQESGGLNTNVESTLGGGDFIQPYFRLILTNQLNRYLGHSLSLSREATGSNVSNYQETNALSYQFEYRLNRLTTLEALVGYRFGRLSRTVDPVPYSNFVGRLNLTFQVMKNTDLGIRWNYYTNNLDGFDASYTRQTFTLSLTHRF